MNGFVYCGSKFDELRNLTNEDGLLVVPQGGGSLEDDADARFYVCRMDWGRKEPAQLEEEFTSVCDALRSLVNVYKEEHFPFGKCPAPKFVPCDRPETEVWSIYLREEEEPVQNRESEPEEEFSEVITGAMCDLAEARIGKGADPCQTWKAWNRGQRYSKLFDLGAPSLVIKKEEEDFAVDFALHACAKEIRSVNLYKDRYDPETKCFGKADDAEITQLLQLLETSPHVLREERAGYLLLLNKIYFQDQAKLCDLTFQAFARVKELFDEIFLGRLSNLEQSCIQRIYGLEDGIRRSEAEVGAEHGLSGQKIYEIEATAIRKMRHPVRRREISNLLEEIGLGD